jgi:hypothetical protein
MRNECGDDQVRITVRLPAALYHAILAARRTRVHWGNSLSDIVRHALQHALACPERGRMEEENDAIPEQQRRVAGARCAAPQQP